MRYVATINVPGYMPTDDDPPVFDTAAEAWAWLESERERAEQDAAVGPFVASDCLSDLRHLAEQAQLTSTFVPAVTTGSVYGPTPGSDSAHDLGLAYSVSVAEE